MAATLKHPSLQSTLQGVQVRNTTHFRGIPYGKIPKRFAVPETITDLPSELDCRKYGPRCPQVPVDAGHLLRIPKTHKAPVEPEDEFLCANLDVVAPSDGVPQGASLPVLIWIHGGSQAVTFGSAASGVCDMTTFVADSIKLGKPIIAVAIQHRLNIFAMGSKDDEVNLAFRDQALALQWVQDHISGFGGDPKNVTLAGESAGAVYTHGHAVSNAPVNQFIFASGSMSLSPPQPLPRVSFMRSVVASKLQEIDSGVDLSTASAEQVVEAINRAGIPSFFLQDEELFKGWSSKAGIAQRYMVSDVQKEAVIWQAGIWATNSDEIVAAFDKAGEHSEKLKTLYHIYPDRPSSCKHGALDFLNDARYLLPLIRLARLWEAANKSVFRYLADEINPWQPSTGSHHGVDVPLLFGGVDLSASPTAAQSGQNMREAWIKFVNSEHPFPEKTSMHAFGPYGVSVPVGDSELRARRRVAEVEVLDTIDQGVLDTVFGALAAGKISLLN